MKTRRDPNVDLLLRGDVIALSPLEYERARDIMLEALRDVLVAHTQRIPQDPAVALIEALSAGIDVLGLYHDRFLTESKLGSALRIQSVARLAQVVGYVPRPRIAARALQFFEAAIEALLPEGTRVAGKRTDPAGTVVFETETGVSIGPAFNAMVLPPVLTRRSGALRAVLELWRAPSKELLDDRPVGDPLVELLESINALEDGEPTVRDDFWAGTWALFNGVHGLELGPVTGSRARAAALERGLGASYRAETTMVHAAYEVRHLRTWAGLDAHPDADDGPELVVFELADAPVLHRPDASVEGGLASSLEVFLFEGTDDPGPPDTWRSSEAWTEVRDFSSSEASDRHYRLFVDERLHTYLLLRRRLGYRLLLDDDALCRVFVRWVPAIGRLHAPLQGDHARDVWPMCPVDTEKYHVFDDPLASDPLHGALLRPWSRYFETSLVHPTFEDPVTGERARITPEEAYLGGAAHWAVTSRALDVKVDDQIAIVDPKTAKIDVRELTTVRDRYLAWDPKPPPAPIVPPADDGLWARMFPRTADIDLLRPANEAIALLARTLGSNFLTPATYRVVSGRGPYHPADVEKYRVQIPAEFDAVEGGRDPRKTQVAPLHEVANGRLVPFWNTFYENVSVPPPADLELVGNDETTNAVVVPEGAIYLFLEDTSLIKPGGFILLGERAVDNDIRNDPFKSNQPFENAEIVQAEAVFGRIVQLRHPTAHEYSIQIGRTPPVLPTPPEVTRQVLAVPLVASVYYGDRFEQTVPLSETELRGRPSGRCRPVALVGGIDANQLQVAYGWPLPSLGNCYQRLFVAAAGEAVALPLASWAVRIDTTDDDVRPYLSRVENADGDQLALLSDVGSEWVYDGAELWTPSPARLDLYGEIPVWGPADFSVSAATELTFAERPNLEAGDFLRFGSNRIQVVDVSPAGTAWHVQLVAPPTGTSASPVGIEWDVLAPSINAVNTSTEFYMTASSLTVVDSFTLHGDETVQFYSPGNILLDEARIVRPPGAPPPPSIGGRRTYQLHKSIAGLLAVASARLTIKRISPAAITIQLTGLASALQAPYVMSFESTVTSFATETLHYTNFTSIGPIVRRFDFVDTDAEELLERYEQAGATNPTPFIHTNVRDELCAQRYVSGGFPDASGAPGDRNFFTTNDASVYWLEVVDESTVFPHDASTPKPVFLTDSAIPSITDGMLAAGSAEVGGGPRLYVQSVVFNSGNFIPLFSTEADPEQKKKIVEQSMRVRIELDDGAEFECKYHTDLSGEEQELVDASLAVVEEKYLYDVNKTVEGVFTINVLALTSRVPKNLLVEVEYAATKVHDPDADAEDWRIYAFETPVLPWNPLKQIVLLDTGELETGHTLFLHTDAPDKGYPIQWTRIVGIHGRVVDVEPALHYQPRAIRYYTLNAPKALTNPATLHPSFYGLLHDATLELDLGVDSTEHELPWGDTLMLHPVQDAALLDALVVGDRLLVWDQRYRNAWVKHRQGNTSAQWRHWDEWPDYQYETRIKAIDRGLGQITLVEPLPSRFKVKLTLTKDNSPPSLLESYYLLEADPDDYDAIRVLPHYREPFQGTRRLVAVGSGDQGKRFQHFATSIPLQAGSATVPLRAPNTETSNVEVLTVNPLTGEWLRWTQWRSLASAARGDAAVTVGIADVASDASPAEVDLTIAFGDGVHGRVLPNGEDNVYIRPVSVGRWDEHLHLRRPLRILAMDCMCAPFSTEGSGASVKNLWLQIEHGAHGHWRPAGGIRPWRGAMTIELHRVETGSEDDFDPCFQRLRELTCDEAKHGHDGFWVEGSPRPGVVDVFIFTPDPIAAPPGVPPRPPGVDVLVKVWAEPQSRVWQPDAELYANTLDPRAEPDQDPPTRVALLETRGLRKGSLLAFERTAEDEIELAVVAAVEPDTYSLELERPLRRRYPEGSRLRGNLAWVTEGESEELVVGSGDGRTPNLRVPLFLDRPMMYRADDGKDRAGLTIQVDGQPWREVDDLANHGLREHVYRLDRDPSGEHSIVFGDGRSGAIPSRATDNIVARIRFGSDGPAALPRGAIDKLRSGNLAVAGTRNLTAAAGGRLPENPDEVRETLLTRGLPYTRAVTAEDVARLALEVGEVLSARVDPRAHPGTRVVVALVERRPATQDLLDEIRRRLLPRMPVTAGVDLEVVGARLRPVHIVVTDIEVDDGREVEGTLSELELALGRAKGQFFAADAWPIGRALELGDLYEAIFAVPGIARACVRWMSTEVPPDSLPTTAPRRVAPGYDGVIQCDDDPADGAATRGTLRLEPKVGGSNDG